MTARAVQAAAGDAAAQRLDLEQAMDAFAGISESLVKSYQALSERARMVEEELGRANVELKRKVAELDRANRHLEAVLQSLPTGVVVRGADGRIARINGPALAILAASGAASGPELGQSSAAARASAAEKIYETTGRGGVRLVVAARRSELRDARGVRDGTVEILDDRTELTSLSERMHALDKMAALGTMGGGIAHELRNPLNAVKGFAELILRELDEKCAPARGERATLGGAADARVRRFATRIVEGAAEADAIIASLLAFATPERVKLEPIDGRELALDACELALGAARAALGETSPHAVRVDCDAPPFQGDRIKLRQALRNLIANAAEAQPQGGAIHVQVTREQGFIAAAVADAGPGIPAELRSRVLDPFFTTRPEGTGLGLALVATIARLHCGSLDVGGAPAPLGGARVTLRIPFQPVQRPLPRTAEPQDEKAS